MVFRRKKQEAFGKYMYMYFVSHTGACWNKRGGQRDPKTSAAGTYAD